MHAQHLTAKNFAEVAAWSVAPMAPRGYSDILNLASKCGPQSAFRALVRNREGGKGFWTRIGSAWAHKDDNGFNIQLESAPIDGRITLRVASEKVE